MYSPLAQVKPQQRNPGRERWPYIVSLRGVATVVAALFYSDKLLHPTTTFLKGQSPRRTDNRPGNFRLDFQTEATGSPTAAS